MCIFACFWPLNQHSIKGSVKLKATGNVKFNSIHRLNFVSFKKMIFDPVVGQIKGVCP